MTAVRLQLSGFCAYAVVLPVGASAPVSPPRLFPSEQQGRTLN
jgi:hypothetical protein